MNTCLLAGAMLLCVLIGGAARGAELSSTKPKTYPVLLGVNLAGDYHMMNGGKWGYEYEPFFRALAELGVEFVDLNFLIEDYLKPIHWSNDRVLAQLGEIDARMRAHGIRYVLNNELSNWVERLEITPGVNEFSHADGTHRWDLRMEWLEALLPPRAKAPPALIGVNYDEADHMILSNNMFSTPDNKFDVPYLVDTTGMPLDAAFDKLVGKLRSLREAHYKNRLPLGAEFGFPDMFHIYAAAGWAIAPKLLKENVSVVSACAGLGAALQYADRGTDLWFCNDLWNQALYPGHSPAELRSALTLGYWLGASRIYVESLDYHGKEPRHSQASAAGSLLDWRDAEHCELTNHGKIVRDFYKDYVPRHPRDFSWRDYRPRVAIVRLPDGCWGQKGTWYRDRLLGNRQHPEDAISEEWLHVWPILTHGKVVGGAICSQNHALYPTGVKDFFMPIDSVAVFDHQVKGPVLDSVECFIVCGQALSKETFEAVRARVRRGATCIIARRLFVQYVKADEKPRGDWLVVDRFTDPAIAKKLQPFLGPADVMRFRFKDRTLEFRAPAATDTIAASTHRN